MRFGAAEVCWEAGTSPGNRTALIGSGKEPLVLWLTEASAWRSTRTAYAHRARRRLYPISRSRHLFSTVPLSPATLVAAVLRRAAFLVFSDFHRTRWHFGLARQRGVWNNRP